MEKVINKMLKAQHVIYKRIKTTAADFELDMIVCFTELFEEINWKLDRIDGDIFAMFHNGKSNSDAIDVEFCVPVEPDIALSSDRPIQMLPSYSMTLCTTFYGDIEGIDAAYDALTHYATANYHKLMLPLRETYLDYSGQQMITEIAWPIDLDVLGA